MFRLLNTSTITTAHELGETHTKTGPHPSTPGFGSGTIETLVYALKETNGFTGLLNLICKYALLTSDGKLTDPQTHYHSTHSFSTYPTHAHTREASEEGYVCVRGRVLDLLIIFYFLLGRLGG